MSGNFESSLTSELVRVGVIDMRVVGRVGQMHFQAQNIWTCEFYIGLRTLQLNDYVNFVITFFKHF